MIDSVELSEADRNPQNQIESGLDFEKFTDKYKIIKGDRQNDLSGKHWSTEQLLSEYVRLTDGLISVLDGRTQIAEIRKEKQEDGKEQELGTSLPPPESVIWLDKSARPISWIVREMWSTLARKPDTSFDDFEIPKRPEFYYRDIDKKTWMDKMGVPRDVQVDAGKDEIDLEKIPNLHEELSRLRATFIDSSEVKITEDNLEDVWKKGVKTRLDGQHVVVVDDVEMHGVTLELALQLLRKAIPDATFTGVHWMSPGSHMINYGRPDPVSGKMPIQPNMAPIWYGDNGQGIGGVENAGERSNDKERVGVNVLGYRVDDAKNKQLRQEAKYMAEDMLSKNIFYQPGLPNVESHGYQKSETDEIYSIGHKTESFEECQARVKALTGLDWQNWRDTRDKFVPHGNSRKNH